MPPPSPLLSLAGRDVLSSQHKTAPHPLFHPELNANGTVLLCYENWRARIVPISVIGHDVGSCAWGKGVGDISATNIFTEFINCHLYSEEWNSINSVRLNVQHRIAAHDKGARAGLLTQQDLCKEEELLLWKHFKWKNFQKGLISLWVFSLDSKCWCRMPERILGLLGKLLHPTLFTLIPTLRETREHLVFSRLSQLLLVCQTFHVLNHPHGPLSDSLQFVHTFLAPGSPELTQ